MNHFKTVNCCFLSSANTAARATSNVTSAATKAANSVTDVGIGASTSNTIGAAGSVVRAETRLTTITSSAFISGTTASAANKRCYYRTNNVTNAATAAPSAATKAATPTFTRAFTSPPSVASVTSAAIRASSAAI